MIEHYERNNGFILSIEIEVYTYWINYFHLYFVHSLFESMEFVDQEFFVDNFYVMQFVQAIVRKVFFL